MNKLSKLTQFFLVFVLAAGLLAPAAMPVARAGQDPPRAHPALLQLAAEHPDDTFMVIIQREVKNKDLADDDPETAVDKAGGRVRKQLQMIESFSAELTGKEIEKLAKNPKVRWISFDAPLFSTAAGDPTVRDEFGSTSYANNNGTQSWAGNWTETGDDGMMPGSGYVKISSGSLQLKYTSRTISRPVNLTGAVLATLSFQYKRSSFDDANDYVAIQVSANGGSTWTELARYAGPGTDSAWQTASFNIQSYAASNTQIRFATSASLGSSDILYVDNVQIEYASASKFTAAVRADQLWSTVKGQNVTVAVVDSGIVSHDDLKHDGNSRIIAETNQTNMASANDGYGHGTHVAGIIGGNGSLSDGVYSGVAPRVNLINVKVSNDLGLATASDLIDGLQWILDNKAAYNIKVVNISLNSTVAEPYHTSALDAAVEILWFNGIVVVVAAGNNGTGTGPVTLYPPANDPFVITVGAAEDKGTPALSDDTMAAFSAYGTTENSFAKPDLVAPGRHIVSTLASTSVYAFVNHLLHRVDSNYFRMSGTSMAAPVVSGAAALLLQDEPNLTPDQVKYRLKATANTAWAGYDAAKAGAGYLDAYAAVYGTTTQSANTGIAASQMLFSGSDPVTWGSVNWNSVNWNSVNWNSVNWNSVNWNTVNWNSAVWDD
ncbi:MAG: S8 family serine peptidase [Chloroflexota bacterium]